MLKKTTLVAGAVLLFIGILGFVPGVSTTRAGGQQMLFGIFMTGLFHNVFHLVSGAAGLLAAASEKYARWYLRIFGLIYAGLALLRFTVGIPRVNMADNILHAVVAAILLAVGFGVQAESGSTPAKSLV